MQQFNNTTRNVGKAVKHYMGLRLKFRGTVFADARNSEHLGAHERALPLKIKTPITKH